MVTQQEMGRAMIWSIQRSPKLQMDFADLLLLCQILKVNSLSLELCTEGLGPPSLRLPTPGRWAQLREPRMPSGDTGPLRAVDPLSSCAAAETNCLYLNGPLQEAGCHCPLALWFPLLSRLQLDSWNNPVGMTWVPLVLNWQLGSFFKSRCYENLRHNSPESEFDLKQDSNYSYY